MPVSRLTSTSVDGQGPFETPPLGNRFEVITLPGHSEDVRVP
jgi:hypothetical protein